MISNETQLHFGTRGAAEQSWRKQVDNKSAHARTTPAKKRQHHTLRSGE